MDSNAEGQLHAMLVAERIAGCVLRVFSKAQAYLAAGGQRLCP